MQQQSIGRPPIVALDLSLTGTGIALLLGDEITTSTVSTKADDGTVGAFNARCDEIAARIVSITAAHDVEPALVLVEGLSMHSKSSSLDKIFASWWMILGALRLGHGWPEPVKVSPSQRAQYATGKGNASKDTVLLAAARRYPDVEIKNNNEADALVIGAMGARYLGFPLEESLPQTQLAAMTKVVWPTPSTNEWTMP